MGDHLIRTDYVDKRKRSKCLVITAYAYDIAYNAFGKIWLYF